MWKVCSKILLEWINRKKMVEYIWVMTNNFACQEEKENLIKNKLREKIMNITFIWFSGDD